jgi:hypothetical protein
LPFLDSCHHSTVDDQFFFGRTYGASGHTELHALSGRKGSTSCEFCHRKERLRLISISFGPSRSTYKSIIWVTVGYEERSEDQRGQMGYV